ncbi:hypothetical protein HID58_054342 [Brassica napus]|uniref:Uncharacterized protein n=2 Tax=Brassica TaxID=3705 RepID=A0ABQ8AHK3_BRANA|nr:hypothetical protein HID58_054342 [Brassica napus]
MCEVSREYKYNRQAFDYKAREMTEKYAVKVYKSGVDGSSTSLQIQETPIAAESHGNDKVSESGISVLARNHEKPDGIKPNLAVESSLSMTYKESRNTDQQMDGNGKRKAAIGFCEANTSGNNGGSRKKLSLALPPRSQKKDLSGEELTHEVSAACKENKKPHSIGKKLSLGLKKPLVNAASLNNNLASSGVRSSAAKSDNNRLSRKLSLRPLRESQLNEVSKAEVLAQTEMNQNQDVTSWGGEFENSALEEASMPESIVVLDSEESGGEEEEATVASRSRLLLARRGSLKCESSLGTFEGTIDVPLASASMPESIVVLKSEESGREEEESTVSLKSRLSLARRGLKCVSSLGTFEPTIDVPLARWMCWMQSLAYGSGAWQPSLNISTVLTSIGLLLSEPNPDDDLMCEVMTQKYAVKVNAGDGSSTSLQIQETPNAGEVKSHGDEKVSESGIRVLARNHENPDGIKPNLAKPLVNAASLNNNLACSGVRSSAAKSDNNRLSGKLFLRPLGESQLNEVSKAEVLAQTEMNENQDPKSWGEEFEKSVLEEASMPESIVVLDSEESGGEEEEATVSLKSRLSLARRGLQCGRP